MHGITTQAGAFKKRIWTPNLINTKLWFDASDTSTITDVGGGVASQWRDISGNNNHLNQSNNASRPITGTRSLNGLNVLDFDGSNDNMILTNQSVIIIDNSTRSEIWAVWLVDNHTTNNKIFGGNGNTQVSIPQNTQKLRLWNTTLPWGSDTQSNVTYAAGQGHVTGWLAHTVKKFSNNGTLHTTGDNFVSGRSLNIDRLGKGDFSPTFDGIMGEVLVCDELSSDDRSRMEGYLAHKWGLEGNLPASHPYKTTSP